MSPREPVAGVAGLLEPVIGKFGAIYLAVSNIGQVGLAIKRLLGAGAVCLAGPRRAGEWPRRRRSWSGRRCCRPTRRGGRGGRWTRRRPRSMRARSARRWTCWPGRKPGRSPSSSRPALISCGPRSRCSPPAGWATLRRCCSGRPSGWSRSMPAGPGDLPGRGGRRGLRQPPGQPGRFPAGGGTRSGRGTAAAAPTARTRSPPRWPGSGLRPGVRGRGADPAPGPAGLRQRRARLTRRCAGCRWPPERGLPPLG